MVFNIQENSEKFNFKGRYAFVSGRLCLDFTACGFELKADFNNSNLQIDVEITGEPALIGVILDGDYNGMYEIPIVPGKQKITVAEKLNSVHTVRVVKLLECRRGLINVESVIFDGEIMDKPDENKLKFEFYGDSLTCGYGNLATTRNSPNPFGFLEHGYKTWATMISQKFSAEMSAVSSSGQGVLTDCDGSKEGTIFKYYDKAVPTYNIDWDFEKFVPDYIFIYIGVNDINYRSNNPEDRIDWNEFYRKSKELLNGILSHSPKAKIIYLTGHGMDNPFYEDWRKICQKITDENDNVYFCSGLSCTQSGGDWHPNLADEVMIFDKLYSFMKENFNL